MVIQVSRCQKLLAITSASSHKSQFLTMIVNFFEFLVSVKVVDIYLSFPTELNLLNSVVEVSTYGHSSEQVSKTVSDNKC